MATKKTSDTQRFSRAAADVPMAQRLSDLEAILGVTRAMAAEQDLTRLLTLLTAACSNVLQVERSTIWVVDPEAGDVFTRVAEGMDAIRVPKGKGIVGVVAASGEPLVIPDAYADPRFNQEIDKQTGFTTRQILCHPLKDIEQKRVVGVIQALNKTGGRNFVAYDTELAAIFAAQAGVVLEQAALRELAIEKKRLQAEMDLARSIQQRLLPRESPELPRLDVAGCNRPATETSGDYFDYATLPDGRFAIMIADVTGHGLGAALIMTAARAFVRALCGASSDPSNILAVANRLLAHDLENGNFLSFLLAAFDPEGRTLEYSSAGHDPPLCFRPSKVGAGEFAELDSTGPLLGIVDGMEFGLGGPVPLEVGDILVFMTDGLFECMNANDETFGKDRVREIIRKHSTESAAAIMSALTAAANTWSENQPPRDDITIVVVKVR